MKNVYSKGIAILLFLLPLFAQSQIFSENIGSGTSSSVITYTGYQNNGTLTFGNGAQTNPADVRTSSGSSGYTGASGGSNVYFTATSGAYGFSIEGINASGYTSLTLAYAYRKEGASVHASFSVDYWDGTAWQTLANTASTLFNEAASATSAWYLAKTLSLPAAAQINGLKIRFVKTGTAAIRIDDIILSGTLSCTPPANPTGTISGTTPACTSTTLSYSAPSATEYWETSATGTSTSNPTTSGLPVSTSGTYYVRTYNGTCWSTGATAGYAVVIHTPLTITGQPTSPAAVCGTYGGNLSVTVSGTSPTYQWQYSADGTTNWNAVVNGTPSGSTYTNATTATMTIAGLTQTGYYRVVASSAVCPSATSNVSTVTINPVPAAPTGTSPQAFCSNPTPTVAGLSATGTTIKWYAASSGGTALATTVNLVNGTTYYASQTVGGCESTTRLPVTVNITTTPGAPTGTASQSFCGLSNPTVANLAATGTNIQWYAASSGGSPLATSTALVNGTHYYATQSTGSCESATRFDVTATVIAGVPAQPAAISGSTTGCQGVNGAAYSITAVSGATSYTWSYTGTGATINGTGTNVTVDFTAGATSGNLQVTANNLCGSGVAQTLAITAASCNTILVTASSYGPFCNSTSNNVSVSFTNTGSYAGVFTAQLSDASGSFASPVDIGTGTSPISATIPAGTAIGNGYRIRVINTSPVTTSSNDNGSNIIINNPPAITTQPTTPTPVCTSFTGSISGLVATGSNITYQWQYSANGSTGWANVVNGTPAGATYTNATTATLSIGSLTSTGYYRATISNGGCTAVTTNVITVSVTSTPAQPSTITGTSTPYAGQTASAYSVTNVAGVTYTWTFSGTGATITGQGNNAITIDFAANATSGTLTVTPSIGSCTGTARNLTLTIAPANDLCTNGISLITNVTTNGTTVNATMTTLSNDYGYTKDIWYKLTAICGGSITVNTATTGQDLDIDIFTSLCPGDASSYYATGSGTSTTTESVTFTATAGTTYYIRISQDGGTSNTFTILASGSVTVPAQPGSITGSTSICANTDVTYSITAVPNTTSYTWTLPSGWTGTSTTNSITVTTGSTSGNVSVTANNGCGSSSAQSLAVSVTAISTPTATAGTLISSNGFTANWNAVAGATGYFVDVYTYVANVTLANWTFPSSGTTVTPDASSTGNSAQTLTVNGGTSGISDAVGATTRSASATGWDAGSGTKYWQVSVNTTGFSSLTLSSKQRSSGTGPRDFKVQYKIGSSGTWTDAGVTVAITTTDFTTGVINAFALPAACNNQSSLFLRWIMTSNTSQSNGTVAGGGTSQIDDILIAGSQFNYVSGYQNLSVPATDNFLEVTGLSASTTYYYIVRATDGTCTSSSSNQISVTTLSPCTPTATITSFNPATGPQASLVTITGTGFTGATAVKFGSVNATSFSVVNSTTIIAKVPANTPTDKISVTVASCPAYSATNFTLLTQSNCGNSVPYSSDIFISEVYDADQGSLSYIEIFNGTAASVNLSSYFVRFRTGTSTDNDYALSGTLASGATMVLSVGTSSTTCTIPVTTISFPAGSGFNGNDRVYLYKNTTMIDYVPNPNYGGSTYTGFSQVRKPTSIGPTSTYTASDWVISDVESCSNLGIAPYTFGGSTVTITAQPSDVGCTSTITLTANATSSTGNTAYVWYFNDPSTMNGWGLVSDLNNSPYNYGVTVVGSGTNSITITGSTGDLGNFQFYATVASGGSPNCTVTTNAAQYSFESRKYYRSTQNGNWNNETTWQMSNDNSSWVAACNYPRANNSSSVSISHNVVLPINVDIDNINIAIGGTLDISTSGKLTVYDSTAAAADFTVLGTLIDNGSSANGISFGTGASWSLGANGTIIRTNLSSSTAYRDNYYLGMVNIPATANWIIRKVGSSDVSFTSVAGSTGSYPSSTYYPNLTFENATGSAYTFTNKFTGASDYPRIKGNLDIGGTTYTTGVTVINDNTNAQALQVSGNLVVRNASTLTNAGTATGTGFDIKGNVTIDGTLTANNASTGLLKFSGTSTQTISGSGNMNLQDVTVDNTGAGNVVVSKSFKIPGVLTMGNAAAKLSMDTGHITMVSTATSTARVATIPSGASILYPGTGRFIVERYIGTYRKWQFLAIPTDNTQTVKEAWQEGATSEAQNPVPGYGQQITNNASDWASNGFDNYSPSGPSMKTFVPTNNAVADSWLGIASTNIGIKTTEGYMTYVRGDRLSLATASPTLSNPTTLRTKGKLYTGTITIPVPSTQFASIGNPYASQIDLTKVVKTGLTNDFYVWDPNLGGYYGLGNYRTLTYDGVSSYLVVPAGGNYGSTRNTIESGQAFFVRGTGAASPSLQISETSKGTSSSMLFRTQSDPQPVMPSQYLSTNLNYTDNNTETLMDGNLVIFRRNYSNAVDYDDALKLSYGAGSAGLLRNNKLLAIERRGEISNLDTLYLAIGGLRAGNYNWELNPVNLAAAGRHAYLVDRFQHTTTELDLNGRSKINFNISTAASAATDRFVIVFRQRGRLNIPGNVPDWVNPRFTLVQNPVQAGSIKLTNNGRLGGVYTYRINDRTNTVLNQGKFDGNLSQIQLRLPLLINAQYFLQIFAENGELIQQIPFTMIR